MAWLRKATCALVLHIRLSFGVPQDMYYSFKFHILESIMMRAIIYVVLVLAASAVNPGIVVGIPLPYDLPVQQFPVPYDLQPFTIESAQFTNVQIKELQWNTSQLLFKKKSLVIKECLEAVIQLDYIRVHFNVEYKGAYGPGDFIEYGVFLLVEFDLVDNNKKMEIVIKKMQLQYGRTKIQLGGTIEERFLSIITSYLLSFGQPILNGYFKNIVKKQLANINSLFVTGVHIQDNMFVDLSNVAAPLIEQDFVTLSLNGAAYVRGATPPILNPSQLMKIDKSANLVIQVQAHESMVNSLKDTYLSVHPFKYEIFSIDITGVIDITSLSLSPVFPKMSELLQPQNVLFTLGSSSTMLSLVPGLIKLNANSSALVSLSTFDRKNITQYCQPVTGKVSVDASIVFGKKSVINIEKIDIPSLSVNPEDIANGKVIPESFTMYQKTLLQWLASALNSELNIKGVEAKILNLNAVLIGSIKSGYIMVEVAL